MYTYTEKELFQNKFSIIVKASQAIRNKTISIEDIGQFLPGIVHINEVESLGLKYINKSQLVEDFLGYESDELIEGGLMKIKEISHPYYFQESINKMAEFKSKEVGSYTNFVQAMKKRKTDEYIPLLTQRSRINDDFFFSITYIDSILYEFKRELDKAFGFIKEIDLQYPLYESLTPMEKKLLSYIAKGYTSQEMAERCFISVHTVNTHRKNIKQKLQTKTNADLIRFGMAYQGK